MSENDSSPLLEVCDVSKSFPGVRALSGMHLRLRRNEVLALVGENGAGKSTLMKLLSGMHRADGGHFRLDGEPFAPAGPKQAREQGISIIHQEFNLMPHLTVAQNLFIGREPLAHGFLLRHRELDARAAGLVDRLHLPLDVRATVGTLTVAQQQMVEIAKALSYDARVLIMDEPTAALNEAEVATLHELIRRFVGDDTGVVYISHRMDELKAVADRVTVIRDGRHIATVDAQETTTREVVSLMVGRALAGAPEHEGPVEPVDVSERRKVVLSAEGLSTRTLLRDVSFELREGEILGFAGLMGAGRTEVARALVGADRLTSGTLRLRGETIEVHSPADAAKHRIGYLSEDRKQFGLLLEQDVSANIALGSLGETSTRLGVVRDRALRARSEDYVASLGIRTPSVSQQVRNLSGGNQQKVVIARWLAKDCDVLIFDEPTRGIDVGAKEEIYALLRDLVRQGRSIIMISSELPEVLRMSHRIVVMSEGRVTACLSAAEATQEEVMHHATLRPEENRAHAPALGGGGTAAGASRSVAKTGER